MRYVDEFRDPALICQAAAEVRHLADPSRHYRIMEVCGGHTHAIYRFGLEDLLAAEHRAHSRPGVPGLRAADGPRGRRPPAGRRRRDHLLAFGRGSCATDAQHVSVEFVHPVIVGKRALPALDLSLCFEHAVGTLTRADDIVMGFAPPGGDAQVARALQAAAALGAQTFALPGLHGSYALAAPCADRFLQQELIEGLDHTLWETVHVFFEHRERGHDVGASGFLYPFLGSDRQDTSGVVDEVERSIREKAAEDERLREAVVERELDTLAAAVTLIANRLQDGGTLLLFGNGGSATDANDWALDCVDPPDGMRAVRAISLSAESATLTALANDIGRESIFERQLIAHARPADIAVGISTSGGSSAVVAALEEARRRGLATVALLGHDGSEIERRRLADVAIVVRSDYIPRIQEVQASIYHAIIEAVDASLGGLATEARHGG